MDNSDSDYKAAIARNQMNFPTAAGETPVDFMLDMLYKMVEAFAKGVWEGYKETRKGKGMSQQKTQELANMQQNINNMMTSITQLMQAQQIMQAQLQNAQQQVQQQPVQQAQPEKVQAQAQPEKVQAQAKPENAQQQVQQQPVQQAQPEKVQAQAQPEKVQTQAQPENVQQQVQQPVQQGGAQAGGSKPVQQGQVKPMQPIDVIKQYRKIALKNGGIKWFSDAEIDKTINSLNGMKDKDGKLPPAAKDFLKSMTQLKERIAKEPNGMYADSYVKAFDAANNFSLETIKSKRQDQAAKDAMAMADVVHQRLAENERIYSLRNTVPWAQKIEKKYGKEIWNDGPDVKREKEKAIELEKKEKMYEKAKSEVKKARVYAKNHEKKMTKEKTMGM